MGEEWSRVTCSCYNSVKCFQWETCLNWAKKGGGSISPSTTPPPCHAPTSKASRLIPNTQPLHLCHHILPLVNKRLLNLNWKMAVHVKSLERKYHKNTNKGMNKCTFYYCVMCIMTLSAQMWLMNNSICTRVVKILLYTYLYVYSWPCIRVGTR